MGEYMEDTNQDTGVSLDELANALPDDAETDEVEATEGELDATDSEADDSQDDADDGMVDAEYDGKTYRLPPELKDALLRNADYTRKTQEVAEQRRYVEQQHESLQAVRHAMNATFDKAVELREMQSRIAQLEQLDWQALAGQDATEATKLNFAYQQLQRQAAEKQAEMQQAYAQQQQLEAQNRQQVLQGEFQRLKQSLPAFNEQTAAQIREAARSYGVTDAELDSILDSRYVHVLHDSMQWRNLQAHKPQIMKKAAEAPRVIKPQGGAHRPRGQVALQKLKANGRVEDLASLI